MRFGKERRVRMRAEYVELQRVGRRVTTPHFVLLVSAGVDSAGPSRLGITASRKVGGAVRRNRLKRLVREAFRAYPEVVPPGVDLVVICRRDDPKMDRDGVVAEWKRANGNLRRALGLGDLASRTPHPRPSPPAESPR